MSTKFADNKRRTALTTFTQPGNIRARYRRLRQFGRTTMQRILTMLALGVCANALVAASAMAQATPEVTLTRFDCGTGQAPTEVNLRFSDTYAYPGLKLQLIFSCYLVKHGDE